MGTGESKHQGFKKSRDWRMGQDMNDFHFKFSKDLFLECLLCARRGGNPKTPREGPQLQLLVDFYCSDSFIMSLTFCMSCFCRNCWLRFSLCLTALASSFYLCFMVLKFMTLLGILQGCLHVTALFPCMYVGFFLPRLRRQVIGLAGSRFFLSQACSQVSD